MSLSPTAPYFKIFSIRSLVSCLYQVCRNMSSVIRIFTHVSSMIEQVDTVTVIAVGTALNGYQRLP